MKMFTFPQIIPFLSKLISNQNPKWLPKKHGPQQHQVFINFRGEELRYSFVSYLVYGLRTAGINVFIDKDEQRGEDLAVLFNRIEESKIALVVFSRRYMESKWCLDELVKIKECVDEHKLVAIPIFFKVRPCELQELLNQACENHVNVYETHVHEKWKLALQCITSKMGLSLKEKSEEAIFVNKIVDDVKQRLEKIRDEEAM
uniref:Disease resistance protein RPS4 n=1 Tax=Noccaea caerulescens TaxID=107243 RepID=A0A1J3JCU5_NOCCA